MPELEMSDRSQEASGSEFSLPENMMKHDEPSALLSPVGNAADELHKSAMKSISLGLIRAFDLVVAFVAILLFLPLMLFFALAIRATSPGPAIFYQQRVGLHGKRFPCLKFRTMVVDAQARLETLLEQSEAARAEWARDQKLRNDPRITPLGAFLRRTSLDELPQLFNVLVGQMSIVGPRPIVENEIIRYGNRFAHYCAVRPGLTGLWQISGRNDISYARRVRLDSFYAQRQCFVFNVAICIRTVPAVLASRGSY